ncbi:STAS domain-containing protein [Cereibacter sediminicola]|uniref:STAS domain-containing protein n=1 Tax=Cereibacter sediminicola TaxID=2584941 RepID=UPI0011A45413|nr:STAS domain-containing protein [Cereibacter sediminicola]
MPASPVVLALPERASLADAGGLVADLLRSLSSPLTVRIETEGARDVSLATLQVLVAAHRHAAAAGARLEVSAAPGSAVAEALALHALGQDSGIVIDNGLWTGVSGAEARQ